MKQIIIAIIIFIGGFYAGWVSKPKQEIELPTGSVTKQPDTSPSIRINSHTGECEVLAWWPCDDIDMKIMGE